MRWTHREAHKGPLRGTDCRPAAPIGPSCAAPRNGATMDRGRPRAPRPPCMARWPRSIRRSVPASQPSSTARGPIGRVPRAAPDGPAWTVLPMKYGLRWGEVWGNDDVSAVAVSLPPESGAMTMGRDAPGRDRGAPAQSRRGGALRFLKGDVSDGAVPQDGPRSALVPPDGRDAPGAPGPGPGQRTGRGRASRADAAGVPCYLDTGTQSNVDFYARRGFEVVGQAEAEGFTVCGMVRPPKS